MHEDTIGDTQHKTLWTGRVSRDILEPMFERIIDKYFSFENYYRIAGKPVFSIFDYSNLVTGLGGAEATADAFAWMRRRCETSNLPGLDIQAIARFQSGVEAGAKLDAGTETATAKALGFDSATSYQYCLDSGSTGDYVHWADKAISTWPRCEGIFTTYYPHVSIGWDNTHRNPSAGEDHVVLNATPEAFEACLFKAKAWLDTRPKQTPLITINSWNEWTEGSYLLPDMRWGYRYLQAVCKVLGKE